MITHENEYCVDAETVPSRQIQSKEQSKDSWEK